MVPTEGEWMARKQAVEFADVLAAIGRPSSNRGFELETIRDVTDNVHLATKQPEGVTEVEVEMSTHSKCRVDEIEGAIAEMDSGLRPALGLQTKAA
jgi:hypothetical protein